LAIEPAVARIERSELSSFFQVAFGVSATALLVLILVAAGAPIDGGLVVTGSLLRFLPGASLVSGMHELIDGALASGVARLAEVSLISLAIAGSASLVFAVGEQVDVHLRITADGLVHWPATVVVAAAALAVTFNACRLRVPRRTLLSVTVLGGIVAILDRGLVPGLGSLSHPARVLVAALVVGTAGRLLATWLRAPGAVWMVPAILPLLPTPLSLLPSLAQTEAARHALEAQAVETAFLIGVGVASGSILVESYQRHLRDAAARPGSRHTSRLSGVVRRIGSWPLRPLHGAQLRERPPGRGASAAVADRADNERLCSRDDSEQG